METVEDLRNRDARALQDRQAPLVPLDRQVIQLFIPIHLVVLELV